MYNSLHIYNYYLYRHIRLDKNEPFYIGIGKVRNICKLSKKDETYYERAYTRNGRNKIWHNIVNKNNGEYNIEILMESENKLFIENKEREFIKLYGRKDNRTGILSNMTDGGDGLNGVIWTKRMREAASKRGFNMSKVTKDKISRTVTMKQLKTIYQYNFNGDFIKEWIGVKIASENLKISKGNISQSATRDSTFTAGGFLWRYYKKDKIFVDKRVNNWKTVEVCRLDSNKILIEEFSSVKEASILTGINKHSIYDCLSNKRRLINNEYWIRKSEINFKDYLEQE